METQRDQSINQSDRFINYSCEHCAATSLSRNIGSERWGHTVTRGQFCGVVSSAAAAHKTHAAGGSQQAQPSATSLGEPDSTAQIKMLTAHCFKGNYKGLHVLSFIRQSFHLKNGLF